MRKGLAVRTALVVAVGSAGLISVPNALAANSAPAAPSDNCDGVAICQSNNRSDRAVYGHSRGGTSETETGGTPTTTIASTTTFAAVAPFTATATCPNGSVATGGGVSGATAGGIVTSAPSPTTGTPTGWTVTLAAAAPAGTTAYAVCVDF